MSETDAESGTELRDGVSADDTAKAEKKERTPTKYVALLYNEDTETFDPVVNPTDGSDGRPVLREFEGFRRENVMEDLKHEGLIELTELEGENDVEVTPWLLIVPASSAGIVRGREHVRRSFSAE